ncbi:hypothetical protein SAMN06265337_1822 [Hymenobacter gelipurpurascens]|uniref:Uncharacterized protein n=1 Tax=Hymenobacter gelipurpurascens TaxID=89968 RepID=A0A212TM21_9BACT|nr:hypothetical protein SAMN06265337_1822 [Hymenobacter gelipurpurascens]
MKWLPSFVTLFLVFVAGLVLQVGSIFLSVNSFPTSPSFAWSMYLRLLGLLLMVVSPLLIMLKFFSRLDNKS